MKKLEYRDLDRLCEKYINENFDNPNTINQIINKFTFLNFITWLDENNLEFSRKEKIVISDPDNILEHKSMNIWAKKGHKVTVTEKTINNGYEFDKEKANKLLEIGKEYTIESTNVGDWSTSVILQEIPNERFNSVHFIDIKE